MTILSRFGQRKFCDHVATMFSRKNMVKPHDRLIATLFHCQYEKKKLVTKALMEILPKL